jgi:hypothetical protein
MVKFLRHRPTGDGDDGDGQLLPPANVVQGAFIMPIRRLLEGRAFTPEEVIVLVKAYENAIELLALPAEADTARDFVARRIIRLAEEGEMSADRLCERAVTALVEQSGD